MTQSVAIYLPDLSGGGAERLHVQLAPRLAASGLAPYFLLDRKRGQLLAEAEAICPVESLDAHRQIAALPALVGHLRKYRPAALIANMEHMNVMAVIARAIARAPTRIIACQHNSFSEQVKRPSWQWRALPALYRAILPHADAIVAVSEGVSGDLAERSGIDRSRISVIHNGLVDDDFAARAAGEPDHPWFADDAPVVLGMGRFVPQKDFATLVRAFAHIRDRTHARLMILGEGPGRAELEALIASFGLSDRIALPGFTANPLPWLRRSGLFVLSSRFEGFGNVLVEALACGTPVVSTDCPYGPSEIVEGGRYGALVPVGDPKALGEAILASLNDRPDREALKARGQHFSVARCADAYRDLIYSLR